MNTQELLQHREAILLWYAKQALGVQDGLLQAAFTKFSAAMNENSGVICLLQNIVRCGYFDEQAFATSRTVSQEAARNMDKRRVARAADFTAHRHKVRTWLNKHWGKVVELRRIPLSWRNMQQVIIKEYGINISHTTLQQYYSRWE